MGRARTFLKRISSDRTASSTGSEPGQTEDVVLKEVYRGASPTVDIVAVHGINGDAVRTFTAEPDGCFWLGDAHMLPRDVPNCRVLTFGYPATVASVMGRTSADRILHHAHTLVAELVADRQLEDATERPIIFVCHSLGGIVVKRALVYSANRTAHKTEHLHSIFASTYGVLFFGTPHEGSDVANMARFAQRAVQRLVPSRLVDTDPQLLIALRTNSEVLQDITDNFAPLMRGLRLSFFWEQEKSDLGVTWDYVVARDSAAPILDGTDRAGLRYDHRNMCRFASRTAPGYRLVAASLIRYAKAAPDAVARRWDSERARMHLLRVHEAQELSRPLGASAAENAKGQGSEGEGSEGNNDKEIQVGRSGREKKDG